MPFRLIGLLMTIAAAFFFCDICKPRNRYNVAEIHPIYDENK